ncbi:MAG TPA: Ig-like domain-containing protein, partial [Desertimonas sp.]|nr:Ig-like domain-containing protein [Desertimonas sp.]
MSVISVCMRPGRVRHRVLLVGLLALLVFCVQLALAGPAAAQPFTGAFSPTIIGERADLNGDGVVNGADDSNAFYGDTSIIDGMLDCSLWVGPNSGAAGNGVIATDDDCELIGYDGTVDGVTIVVSGGEFQVADGPLPTVFNAADPDNPDIGDSDFAWSAIGGRVDSNGDETIDGEDCHFGLIGQTVDAGLGDATDGADILGNPGANECGFVSPPAGANNGFVDLNSDTVITALADSCAGCFFGLDVVAGLVQAPGPDTITLEPADATNTVGDPHMVTATVEDMFGNPVVGEDVHFAVTGDGTPDPASGDVDTDAAGEADFTFTNETAGDNTITACVDADGGSDCDMGELSDTATKTWDPDVAAAIDLAPATDSNTVGTDHTVTATVTDQFGNPVELEDVHFDVSGNPTPVPAAGHDITDAAGLATFTFTNDSAGTNTITACIDVDDGVDCDIGEPSDTATKTWTEPPEATSIDLAPATESNPVGTDHTVTATVLDQFGDPFPGADVHFAVSGGGTPVPATGDGVTNAAGQATFTFTNGTEVTNTITGCIDNDPANDTCEMVEAIDTATKTWTVIPVRCPGFAADPRNQVVGTAAGETLTGTAGPDIICGLGGNDTLIGLDG